MNIAALLIQANSLTTPLASGSVHCIVTSPPYWGLRAYATGDNKRAELGSEPLHDCLGWASGNNCGACYVCHMRQVFAELWRVLRDDGTVFLNLGDSYAGSGGAGGDYNEGGLRAGQPRYEGTNAISKSKRMERGAGRWGGGNLPAVGSLKPKDLCGIPWRVALALQADGWYLRSDIIWAKPNPMPESVTDRPTKAHEYIFLLAKGKRYAWNQEAVREPIAESTADDYRLGWYDAGRPERNYPGNPQRGSGLLQPGPNGRNLRTVWTIPTAPFSGSHFAAFPPALAEKCIKAGSKIDDLILDPFTGASTTGLVAKQLNRRYIGLDLSMEYLQMSRERLGHVALEEWVNGKQMQEAAIDDLPLFGGM